MEERFITLRDGKKIFAQIYDNSHREYLLMLHGGPGEGCPDLQYQALKLSGYFNVIIFDQRGVLRSERIMDDENFELDTLVDDCEDIKNILGIKSWYVLGHSFGGELALLYSVKFPASVKKVIFECPTFYYPMSIYAIYNKCIAIAEQEDMHDFVSEVKVFITATTDLKLLTENMRKVVTITSKLDRKMEIPEEVEKMNIIEGLSDDQWQNGKIHFDRLQVDGEMNKDFMPLISQLCCPSLLILGKYDPVCTKEQHMYYSNNCVDGKIIMFENSDHRPHDEEPHKFTQTIVDFLNE